MREMRPLLLPDLVASQSHHSHSKSNSSDSDFNPSGAVPMFTATPLPDELVMTTMPAMHSSTPSAESLVYSTTDSSPLTPISARHVPSGSTSSLSSSPPTYDAVDGPTSSGKLPDLAEEPMDPADAFIVVDEDTTLSPCLCDVDICPHQDNPFVRSHGMIPDMDYEMCLSDDGPFMPSSLARRRKSGDSNSAAFTMRLSNRFPSFSRRRGERRGTTSNVHSRSSSQPRSSRASSVTGVFSFVDVRESLPYSQSARASAEKLVEVRPPPPPPLDLTAALEKDDFLEEPINRKEMASTPLLPPLMVDLRSAKESPVTSPLQSPSVASATPFSVANSPLTGTPTASCLPSPPLSTKPSISSFHRAGHLIPSSEIPPMPIHDADDEWANKLGHANFTILPEPYMPAACDAESCRQLSADWDKARCNFVKHQVRTGEHYGITSRTYKLTEEKWTEIDRLWKKYYDVVVSVVSPQLQLDETEKNTHIVSMTAMPAYHVTNDNGKFPELGDEDIVGPMVQAASKVQYKQSRKAAILRLFDEFKFPASFLSSRNSTSVRA